MKIEKIKKFNFIKQLKEIIFFPFKLFFLTFILVFGVIMYFFKKSNRRNFIFSKNKKKTS